MSVLFAYICTKSSADGFIPPRPRDLNMLARDVSDGFSALQGGYLRVGQIIFFSQQRAVPYHLLCNGQEVPRSTFPELFEFLGTLEGAPADPLNFKVPNFVAVAALTPAASAAAETVVASTVTSEVSSPGTGDSGGSEDDAVDSGARFRGSGPLP